MGADRELYRPLSLADGNWTNDPTAYQGGAITHMDLRERVVGAIEGGLSRREAAEVFGVSPSTAVKWMRRHHDSGSVASRPMGGDHRSRLGGERSFIEEQLEAVNDLTIEELRAALRGRGIVVGYGTVWRFLAKEKITLKKNRARQRARAA